MKRFRKIYFFGLMGAMGGLIAAALHQILLLGIFSRQAAALDRHLYDALLGLLIGAPIGFFPSYMEGRSHYSFARALRSGLVGGLLGAVGGMLSVPLSEVLHNHLGGGIPGRACAVGLMGMTLGIAEGLNGGARWWRGIAGGLVGGLIAGALLELLLESRSTYSDGAIIALILLGLSISLFISLFVNVLSEAWLEGLPGSKIAGQIYQLSRFYEPNEAILGSDKKGQVFIWIPDARERHTAIALTRRGAKLRHVASQGSTLVNGHTVAECLLRNGDVIQVASARLCYRERRASADAPQNLKIVPSAQKPGSYSEPRKASVPSAVKLLQIVLVLLTASSVFGAPNAMVRITQVEMFHGSKARVYVSITDSQGNPLPDSRRVQLEIYEAGRRVASQTVSQGWAVSSVLVLDLSGSMAGEKLIQARAAIQRYIEIAPPAYQVALVGFSDRPTLISGFGAGRDALSSQLALLQTHGNTAIQDALAFGVDLLTGEGRRMILLLTDGRENKSVQFRGQAGLKSVIQSAKEKGVTISVIGLGPDVDRDYLKTFESTGGAYLQAPRPDQLTGLFEKTLGTISKERTIEYDTRLSADGLREKLEARLVLQEPGRPEETAADVKQVIPPGFIPDVKGSLAPYAAVLLILLSIPGAWSLWLTVASVRRFRSLQLQTLRADSKYVGILDPNGLRLEAGQPVVTCPGCSRVHAARSWRNNRCACMVEPAGRGRICLHGGLPEWIRHSLDWLTHGSTADDGRAWLCRCAGDKNGY